MDTIRGQESLRAAQVAMLPYLDGDARSGVLARWEGAVNASGLDGEAAELARMGFKVHIEPSMGES